jgi:ribosomal protein L16/L10AE
MKKNLIKKNHLIATNKYISKNSNFNFSGMLSIISLDSNYISKAAIESARKVLRRKLDKGKGSKL